MLIEQILKNTVIKERADIKAQEISSLKHSGIFENIQYGLIIEIIGEVKKINVNGQSGVEIFARAWKNRKLLGLGIGSSVEIERFRIFNPPILVPDPNGTIIRESTDRVTGEIIQRKLREDPVEAIRQSLAHTIKVTGKEDSEIVMGKIGNTTSTFYPDAGKPGTTSVDGEIDHRGASSYATAHDATDGTHVDFSEVTILVVQNYKGGSLYYLNRVITNFDTDPIPNTDTISSATFSVYVEGFTNDDPDSLSIITNTGASNTDYSTADYDQFGTVKQATDIAYS